MAGRGIASFSGGMQPAAAHSDARSTQHFEHCQAPDSADGDSGSDGNPPTDRDSGNAVNHGDRRAAAGYTYRNSNCYAYSGSHRNAEGSGVINNHDSKQRDGQSPGEAISG